MSSWVQDRRTTKIQGAAEYKPVHCTSGRSTRLISTSPLFSLQLMLIVFIKNIPYRSTEGVEKLKPEEACMFKPQAWLIAWTRKGKDLHIQIYEYECSNWVLVLLLANTTFPFSRKDKPGNDPNFI